jgi:hypothetical protein
MISTIGWLIPASSALIALVAWGTLVVGARRAAIDDASRRRFIATSGAVLLGWFGAALALGASGFFSSGSVIPTVLFALVIPLIAGITAFRRSSVLDAVLNAVPLPWLAGMQLYRVVGGIFLALYVAGELPVEFALPAGAGDVAVGLAAPVVAWMFMKRAQGSGSTLLGWNLVGVLDLVIAVATGFLTSPGPFQAFALESPNRLISAWPLVLVPAFVVPLSILLHLAVFRKLKVEMSAPAGSEVPPGVHAEGWVSKLMVV